MLRAATVSYTHLDVYKRQSVYSAIKNGQTDKALSDANWISIARKLGVNLRGEMEWKAAKTPKMCIRDSEIRIVTMVYQARMLRVDCPKRRPMNSGKVVIRAPK